MNRLVLKKHEQSVQYPTNQPSTSTLKKVQKPFIGDLVQKEICDLKEIFKQFNTSSAPNKADLITTHKRSYSDREKDERTGNIDILAMRILAPNLEKHYLQVRSEHSKKTKADGLKLELTRDGVFVRLAKPIGSGHLKTACEEENVLTGERIAKLKAKVQIGTTVKPQDLASLEELLVKWKPQDKKERDSLHTLRRLLQEINILTALEEDRVQSRESNWPFPKFYGFSIRTKPLDAHNVVITIQIRMEKFDGDLSSLSISKLTDTQRAKIIFQIARGFEVLEKGQYGRSLFHCDLKPENILYKKVGDNFLIAISDFESAIGTDVDLLHCSILHGTIGYISPEAIFENQHRKRDCFALGAIFYKILTGNDLSLIKLFDSLVQSVENTDKEWSVAELHKKYLEENGKDKVSQLIQTDLTVLKTDTQLVQYFKPLVLEMLDLEYLDRPNARTLRDRIFDIRSKLGLF